MAAVQEGNLKAAMNRNAEVVIKFVKVYVDTRSRVDQSKPVECVIQASSAHIKS